MKENSKVADTNVGDIEEAIERLEYIDRTYSYNNYYSIWDLKCIEILLSDYKRVLKENEELKKSKITYEKFRDIQEKNKNIVDNNYIPKQKIKDKIEEINKMIAYEHNDAVIIQLGKQKRVLQKLLESEE